MPTDHVVKQGDGLASIGELYGFFPDTIWNHATNAKLKKKRKDMNVLLEGDVVAVPDLRAKSEDAATEKIHRYRRKGVPAKIRLQLLDEAEPMAKQKYKLDIDGRVFEGKTDAEGWIEHWIPPGAKLGKLLVEGLAPIELPLSHLDPVDVTPGVKARLRNLGFPVGEVNDEMDDQARAALRAFQAQHGLDPTGEPDDATRDKLVEAHRS